MNTEQLKTRLTKEELKNSLENQMFAAFLQGKNGGKFHEWYEANYHDVCLLTVTDFASQESKRAVDEFKEKLKRELKNASIWNNPMVNDYNAKAVNEFIDKL